jgi:predicted  nucleic acid-binding Zn-ribbon protein
VTSTVTIEQLHEELRGVKITLTDLETRIMAVEKRAADDKKEFQRELKAVGETMNQVKNKVESLESLEDANFLAITHMLGVIARKLKIPAKELKTGAR